MGTATPKERTLSRAGDWIAFAYGFAKYGIHNIKTGERIRCLSAADAMRRAKEQSEQGTGTTVPAKNGTDGL